MTTERAYAKSAGENTPRVGFLGMGAMGSRLALRLLDAGYPVTVHDRTPEKAKPLVCHGAQAAATPAEVATACQVVFSCLLDDDVVMSVLLGQDGAFAGARPGTTFIEMSTIMPATSRALATAAHERGLELLDAAISGSTPQVESGTITLLVGGDTRVYERSQPVLSALTERCFHMGPSGMGTTMKLVVNALLGVGMQSLAEALALGEKAGLDKNTLLDVLAQTAVISPRQKLAMENVRREEYPVTFALRLMHKDYGLILREAAAQRVPMPMTAAAEQMTAAGLANPRRADEPDEDVTAIIPWMERLARQRD